MTIQPLIWNGKRYQVQDVDVNSADFSFRPRRGKKKQIGVDITHNPPAFILTGPRGGKYALIPWGNRNSQPGERTAFRAVNCNRDHPWKSTPFGEQGFEFDDVQMTLINACQFHRRPRYRQYQTLPAPMILPAHGDTA